MPETATPSAMVSRMVLQVRGARGRLRLARLRPGQRRLRAPPGVLLGGIEAGAVDRQGDAIAHQLQQLHVGLGEAMRRGAAHAEHPHQPARRLARRLPALPATADPPPAAARRRGSAAAPAG